MSDISIQVEGLSKRYRIGVRQKGPNTLTGALANFAKQPFSNLRNLRRLSKFQDHDQPRQDEIWALKDLSFEVSQGQVVGIIGLNGSGKSTLLKVLSRITEPTEGRAIVRGRVSSLLEVGTGFHPELTGRENTYLNGTILGMRRKEIDRKFDEIVDFSGVSKFIDTPVKRYSSGMLVRLAFAVAAHLEPETLLVDEVLAVGDVTFQQKCLSKMEEVAGSGSTVLFVSHNLGSVSNLCDRAILLKEGRLETEGPARQVVGAYLANAMGDAGMSREWGYDEAPGCPTMKIKSVNIVGADGSQNPYLPTSEPVHVIIEYWILREGARANVGVWLFDGQGAAICSVRNADNVIAGSLTERGLYKTDCTIPGNLLNAGRHSITLGGYTDVYPHPATGYPLMEIDIPQCVGFETVDDQGDRSAFDHRPGIIKPTFDWQTSLVTESQPARVAD